MHRSPIGANYKSLGKYGKDRERKSDIKREWMPPVTFR
jgi:hypothetical protein